jgi:Fic family protein
MEMDEQENYLIAISKMTGLLDLPVLYLSNYIIEHKNEYYANLRKSQRKQIGKTDFVHA